MSMKFNKERDYKERDYEAKTTLAFMHHRSETGVIRARQYLLKASTFLYPLDIQNPLSCCLL